MSLIVVVEFVGVWDEPHCGGEVRGGRRGGDPKFVIYIPNVRKEAKVNQVSKLIKFGGHSLLYCIRQV